MRSHRNDCGRGARGHQGLTNFHKARPCILVCHRQHLHAYRRKIRWAELQRLESGHFNRQCSRGVVCGLRNGARQCRLQRRLPARPECPIQPRGDRAFVVSTCEAGHGVRGHGHDGAERRLRQSEPEWWLEQHQPPDPLRVRARDLQRDARA